MQDEILKATVEFILKCPENLELALHIKRAKPEGRESAAQDIIRHTVAEFIKSEKNRKVASRVTEAMQCVQRKLVYGVLRAVEDKIKEQKPAGWEIQSGHHSYLALRRNGWSEESTSKNKSVVSGAQLLANQRSWNKVYIGVAFPTCPLFKGNRQNLIDKSDHCLRTMLDVSPEPSENSVWWRLASSLADWNQEEFMMAAMREGDRMSRELADGLVLLAQLVEEQICSS